MQGGTGHEHIAEVAWTNPASGDTGQSSRAAMVDFLRTPGNRAYVSDGQRTVEVGVVEASTPYIRTHADGVWTDNLLALPTY
jgi:hypothetical protein